MNLDFYRKYKEFVAVLIELYKNSVSVSCDGADLSTTLAGGVYSPGREKLRLKPRIGGFKLSCN